MSRMAKLCELKPGEAFIFSRSIYLVMAENTFSKAAAGSSCAVVLRLTGEEFGPACALATFDPDCEVEIYEPHP